MVGFGLLAALILTLPLCPTLLFGSAFPAPYTPFGAGVFGIALGPVGGLGALDRPGADGALGTPMAPFGFGLDAAEIVVLPLCEEVDGLYDGVSFGLAVTLGA